MFSFAERFSLAKK